MPDEILKDEEVTVDDLILALQGRCRELESGILARDAIILRQRREVTGHLHSLSTLQEENRLLTSQVKALAAYAPQDSGEQQDVPNSLFLPPPVVSGGGAEVEADGRSSSASPRTSGET